MRISTNFPIKAYGEEHILTLSLDRYSDSGRLAIIALSNGERYATITVNIPDYDVPVGHILVKTWSENSWVPQLLKVENTPFHDTGIRVRTGFMEAQLWRFENVE